MRGILPLRPGNHTAPSLLAQARGRCASPVHQHVVGAQHSFPLCGWACTLVWPSSVTAMDRLPGRRRRPRPEARRRNQHGWRLPGRADRPARSDRARRESCVPSADAVAEHSRATSPAGEDSRPPDQGSSHLGRSGRLIRTSAVETSVSAMANSVRVSVMLVDVGTRCNHWSRQMSAAAAR
jgi:hypothetical protein